MSADLSTTTGPVRRSRVLVVDDEPEIRMVLEEFLTERGYDVLVAETAVGGLGALREHHPDVVLLDLNMPGAVHGTAVVKAMAAEAPVIVVTAINDVEIARGTLQDGAFDFVMKPFDLRRVAEVVEAAIALGGSR